MVHRVLLYWRRKKRFLKCRIVYCFYCVIVSLMITWWLIYLLSSSSNYKLSLIHLEDKYRLNETEAWIMTSDVRHADRENVVFGDVMWNVLYLTNRFNKSQDSELRDKTLEVIKHGGKFIYLTSQLNVTNMATSMSRFRFRPLSWNLKYVDGSLRPLYSHFNKLRNVDGNKSAITQEAISHYVLGLWKTAAIQKSFSQGEATLALDSLNGGVTQGSGTFLSDARAPVIVLPDNQPVLFTRDNVLFHYDAFWAIGVLRGKDHIWSLWVQRLLREIDRFASFAFVNQPSNVICNNCHQEEKLRSISEELQKWHCAKEAPFHSCVISLSSFMVNSGFISGSDFEDITEWFRVLEDNGYTSPPVVNPLYKGKTISPTHRVLFNPSSNLPLVNRSSKFNEVCTKGLTNCLWNKSSWSPPRFLNNILLVIVFNRPGNYGVVENLDKIYRPFFQNILYCGENLEEFMKTNKKLASRISFIEMKDDFVNGEGGYQCVQNAMRMNYDVDGYLHIGDDVLLNIWNIRDFPTDKFWFQQSMRIANLSQPTVPDVWRHPDWHPWTGQGGRIQLTNAINRLRTLSTKSEIAHTFITQLAVNTGGEDKVFYEVSDIFYIPAVFAEQFRFLVTVFDAEMVHIEIAVPNIINGLVKRDNIVGLSGVYLWLEDRAFYKQAFDYSDVFLHPIKLGLCLSDVKCVNFLCVDYLPCLVKGLT